MACGMMMETKNKYRPNVVFNWVEAFVTQGCLIVHALHKFIIIAGIVKHEPSNLRLRGN